jgi:hypothetical protein
MRYTVLSVALPVLGCLAGAAAAQTNLEQCSSYPRGDESYACLCPPTAQTTGAVWGSGPYTLDSNICQAAAHAGAINAGGGPVVAYALEGQESYDGTVANGVQTSTWGAYDASFMFETQDAAPVKYGSGGDCAGFPQSLDIVTCSCTAAATAKGTFWGNDPYTIDSDICIAARHSGIIGPEGGTVTAIRVMGLDNYTSSLNNGVESAPSGPFDGSMVFDRN